MGLRFRSPYNKALQPQAPAKTGITATTVPRPRENRLWVALLLNPDSANQLWVALNPKPASYKLESGVGCRRWQGSCSNVTLPTLTHLALFCAIRAQPWGQRKRCVSQASQERASSQDDRRVLVMTFCATCGTPPDGSHAMPSSV